MTTRQAMSVATTNRAKTGENVADFMRRYIGSKSERLTKKILAARKQRRAEDGKFRGED